MLNNLGNNAGILFSLEKVLLIYKIIQLQKVSIYCLCTTFSEI